MDLNDLNKVWEIKALEKVREDEALEILEKVAKQVQPIMWKRKWKVGVLSEFCPDNPSLLGQNVGGGAEVELRLRRPNNEWDFFRYEQILDTMLHELCHIEHGPHNAYFYYLLGELRKECEDLIAKGITGSGQGFDLPGRRVGGYAWQPPLSPLRRQTLLAAEKRAQRETLLSLGPRRLGGDTQMKSVLSPVQAAAMAAERRLHDDLWCGSKSAENEVGSSDVSMIMSRKSSQTQFVEPISAHVNNDSWQCIACTLLNQPLALTCGTCGTPRNKAIGDEKLKVWPCKFCTLDNSVEVDRCIACEEWRYSYGPPTSTRGPYLGT